MFLVYTSIPFHFLCMFLQIICFPSLSFNHALSDRIFRWAEYITQLEHTNHGSWAFIYSSNFNVSCQSSSVGVPNLGLPLAGVTHRETSRMELYMRYQGVKIFIRSAISVEIVPPPPASSCLFSALRLGGGGLGAHTYVSIIFIFLQEKRSSGGCGVVQNKVHRVLHLLGDAFVDDTKEPKLRFLHRFGATALAEFMLVSSHA